MTSLITALTAVGAVIFSGLSTSATRDQIIVAREEARIAEQGQFTERYTAAVAQIGQNGPAFLQVRLGGIYALERLTRDSPRDHPTIVEVLTAFIRTTTPSRVRPTAGNPVQECSITRVDPDVQAALTVLGRRNAHNDGNTRIDLRSTCLPGAELRSARLDSADLTGAYLFNADLAAASLTDAALGGANLTGAKLTDTDMTKADLNHGYLFDADLSNATLRSADLTATDLTNARLVGADLTDARHQGAVTNNVIADHTTVGKWW